MVKSQWDVVRWCGGVGVQSEVKDVTWSCTGGEGIGGVPFLGVKRVGVEYQNSD